MEQNSNWISVRQILSVFEQHEELYEVHTDQIDAIC